MLRHFPALLAAVACLLPAHAADIVVDTSSDGPLIPVGACTLRQAVTAANSDSAAGGCSAGSGADRILFDGVDSVTVRSALPSITQSLAFDGRGSLVTIRRDPDDVDLFRLLDANTGTTLTLRWIAIENGAVAGATPPLADGAGVRALGTLILEDSRVADNSASGANSNGGGIRAGTVQVLRSVVAGNAATHAGGGIHATGAVTLVDSRIEDNAASAADSFGGGVSAAAFDATGSTIAQNAAARSGGGVYADSVTLTDSVVVGNSLSDDASRGGGVRSEAAIVATRSRVSDNTAVQSGGGLYGETVTLVDSLVDANAVTGAAGMGGGAYAEVQVDATRSTLADNTVGQAGGGAYGIAVTLRNSTLSGNVAVLCGGGLIGALISVQNSTITGNGAGDNASGGICALASSEQAHSLSISNSIVYGNLGDIGTILDPVDAAGINNIIGPVGGSVSVPADTVDCDPQLAPLADNGGPTPTHAIDSASCALDAATNPFDFPTDQRGEARTVGAGTDIGAYELQSIAVFADGFED